MIIKLDRSTIQIFLKTTSLENNFFFFFSQIIFFFFFFFEKQMSLFLDQVEIELIKQIELKSSSFFYALEKITELNDEIKNYIEEIHRIRNAMANLKEQIRSCINVPRMQLRKENSIKALELLQVVSKVKKDYQKIESLIDKKNFGKAFVMIRRNKQKITSQLMEIDCMR